MTDEDAARACNEIYNTWWRKWRMKILRRDSPEWEEVHAEAVEILKRNPVPLAKHMVNDFLDELEERTRQREGDSGRC